LEQEFKIREVGVFKKLAGQTAIYGLSSIVGRMINFLLVPIYTAVLQPADYGILSELYAYVAFLLVFLTFGMETTYFKFIHEAKNKHKAFSQAFIILAAVNALVLVLGVLMINSISAWMLYKEYPEFILLLLLIVVLDAISSLPLAKLRAEEKPLTFAKVHLVSIFTNIALNLILLFFIFNPKTDDPYWGILYILISNLVASLLKVVLLHQSILEVNWKIEKETTRAMLKYTFPIVLAGLAFVVNETLDRILLKQILNNPELLPAEYEGTPLRYAETQVGIYSANYKLTMFITLFLQAFRYAAEPFFFSNAGRDPKRKMYGKIMNVLVAVLCAAFLLVVLNMDFFKKFISNAEYHVGLNVVPILLLANIFLGIYASQSIWYKLSGQTKFGAYISIGGAILTISLLFLFIPSYGYMAAAWTTFTVYGLQMIVSYLLSRRYYPIPYNLKKTGLYFILALGIFGLSKWIALDSGLLKFTIHNLLLLLFLAIAWFFEKNTIKNV
jgi:O-antigen/teichoic acid export membrane protein